MQLFLVVVLLIAILGFTTVLVITDHPVWAICMFLTIFGVRYNGFTP